MHKPMIEWDENDRAAEREAKCDGVRGTDAKRARYRKAIERDVDQKWADAESRERKACNVVQI